MRHRLRERKLGRKTGPRQALMVALVCALVEQRRIRTTLPKAKEARRLAEKMVTLGRRGTLAARRAVASALRRPRHVSMLFDQVVPACQDRQGGYTRIVKLGRRSSDGSEMAILEWVSLPVLERKKKAPAAKAGQAS